MHSTAFETHPPLVVAASNPPPLDYAPAAASVKTERLISLDVFRGLVILAMLVVNNLGDAQTTGYFLRHADWPAMSFREAWRVWWGHAAGLPGWDKRPNIAAARFSADRAARMDAQVRELMNAPEVYDLERARFQFYQINEEFRADDEERAIATAPWSHLPLFTHCTLADFVMPCFMLIIGVAIPFSVAAARAKGVPPKAMWLRAIKRAVLLIVLGWILCYFRDQFAASLYRYSPWTFDLGMDVLQLLGVAYLVARVLYELPAKPRVAVAAGMLLWHWAILRFYPQVGAPAGTLTQKYEAIGHIYGTWPLWKWITLHVGGVTIRWFGLLSVPPAAATMLIGTLVGDWLRRSDVEAKRKVARLALCGIALAVIGFAWAFDLPFNKPRWTPSYLLYVSGGGTLLLAILYAIIDLQRVRGWTYPLVVFGTNAIAVYFLSILAKVLLLNTPRVHPDGAIPMTLTFYGVPAFVTVVLGIVLWKLARVVRRHIGAAAYLLLALALLPAAVMWARMFTQPIRIESQIPPPQMQLHELVLILLKQPLGPWAGAWLFTITFVAFWWLVLEQMYRRRIFWRL
jgi:predicted acyltransferase